MMWVQLAGHLGADPEVRFTQSGQKVTTLRIAVNYRKGKEESTVWWRVTIWGETYDRMMPYLKKGSAIFVIGEMQVPEIYNDREGGQRVSCECTALHLSFSPFGRSDKRNESETTGASPSYSIGAETGGPMRGSPMNEPVASRSSSSTFLSDEVPF